MALLANGPLLGKICAPEWMWPDPHFGQIPFFNDDLL
jgi:hypothetical protein